MDVGIRIAASHASIATTERFVAVDDSEIRPRGAFRAARAASHPGRGCVCPRPLPRRRAGPGPQAQPIATPSKAMPRYRSWELTLAPGRAAFLASRSRCDSTPLPVCTPELWIDGVDGVLAGPGEREAVVGRACTTNATTMYFFFAVRSTRKALRTRQRTTASAGTVSGGPRTAGSHRRGGALEDSWQPPHDCADPCSGAPCTWVPRPRRGRNQSGSPWRQPPTRLRHW